MKKYFFQLNFNQILKCRRYFKGNLKRIIHCLFFSYRIDFSGSQDSGLYVFNTTPVKKRNDYERYMKNFIEQCGTQRELGLFTITYALSFKLFFPKIIFILRFFNTNLSIYDLVQLSQFYFLYSNVSGLPLHNSKIITFCDAHPEDNLLAQLSKNYFRCTTFTLQHGYYTYSPGSINQEVYNNFISDYMLCWGDSSVENITSCGVEAKRLLSFGCFKNAVINHSNGDGIFVLLNGKHNPEGNKELISLVRYLTEKQTSKIIIKKHPDDINDYSSIKNVTFVDSISAGIRLSKVAVISESGVFVDFYLSGFPFFILKTEKTKKEYCSLPNTVECDVVSNLLITSSTIKHHEIPFLISHSPDFTRL